MLREYQGAPDPADRRTLRYEGAERSLEKAATCCFDAGNHLIARLGLARAESYSEIGSVLHSAGIVSEETRDFMRELADIRNRLVHAYWRIHPEEIEEKLPRLIPRFEAFAQEMEQFLSRAP
jgi:uncharacterized protein YutE (UPF0331/DUF86 family)